ncbi:luciferase domain-containing protein [Aliamphritea ceti]|uniref:luciferase domain-containing protein n=1 Tax=Aliamphritea ceti TaxID=1524258 RepID=UPI0021C43138|nr:luciferase family protein [Aliamphritea ceti]
MSKLKQYLRDMILDIPAVTDQTVQGRNGEFTSFSFKGKEFAHFHTGDELDLRLTKKVIASEQLEHPRNSENHPKRTANSAWIELRFTKEADLQQIIELVTLATRQIK